MRSVVSDKSKEDEFDDVNVMRKILHWTEEDIESFSTSNKAKDSVYDETMNNLFSKNLKVFWEQFEYKKTILNSIYKNVILILKFMGYQQVHMKLMIIITL